MSRFPVFRLLLLLAVGLPLWASPIINEFVAANDTGLKDEDGATSDWIEIYNPDATDVSLNGYFLTDNTNRLDKWRFPDVLLPAGGYLKVFASGKDRTDPKTNLHTNFSLDADGGYLALVAPNALTVLTEFAPAYPPQFDNVSFGLGGSPLAWSFFATPTPGATNATTAQRAGPVVSIEVKDPPQPVIGPLTITARIRPLNDPVASVKLYYRRMFMGEVAINMVDDGTNGDILAGDGVWTAIIPATAFGPGEMTRWRISALDTHGSETKLPAYRSATRSPQYFGTVSADDRIQTLLPVLHWFTLSPGGSGTDTGARGSLYYEGIFYDNVFFSLHGQSTASFPKKSYNIDFNPHYHFRYKTNEDLVSDIDLLTNWADKSKVRQVFGYEVMRASGVAAHFAFTIRVQQNGNFFSTADFVERGNEDYLSRAGLNPNGALYKVYGNTLNKGAGDSGTSGVEKKTRLFENNADLQALINGLALTGTNLTNFIYDNVDIARCVDMLAANSVIRNIDMHVKNWYIYRDTGRSGEWAILPWDLDLSQGRVWNTTYTYFDNGIYTDGYIVTGDAVRLVALMFQNTGMRSMIMRRIRTLCDRFLQPPPAAGTPENSLFYERRLNEQLALLDPPTIVPSDAERDFEKWGSWLYGGQQVSYTNTNVQVETMAEAHARWKNEYLPKRRAYIYNTQIVGKGGEIPLSQFTNNILPKLSFGLYDVSPISGNQDQEFIQITNSNSLAVDISDWKLIGGIQHNFTPGTVIPARGSLYLTPDAAAFRARAVAPKGGLGLYVQGGYKGHLSNLGEEVYLIDSFGATNAQKTFPAAPSDAQKYLVVSELSYHPPGDGLAEFIEIMNISADTTVGLTNVHFSQGIDFNFTNSAIQAIAPVERLVIVRDLAAFRAIYGDGPRVAGIFANASSLDNGGEHIKLEDASNQTILEFSYDDKAPWPTSADGAGYTLVLKAPELKPDPDLASNWRASIMTGGTPGVSDAAALPADPNADLNGNGEPDLLDYALGNIGALPPIQPSVTVQMNGDAADLRLHYPRNLAADRAQIDVLYSSDLTNWDDASPFLLAGTTQPLNDGREIIHWTVAPPLLQAGQIYLRVRVTQF